MKNIILATKKPPSVHEEKMESRMVELINQHGLALRLSKKGTRGGKRAIFFIFYPGSSKEDISGLVEDAKKVFKKYEPVIGSGVHHMFVKEIVYPTVYLVAKERGHGDG